MRKSLIIDKYLKIGLSYGKALGRISLKKTVNLKELDQLEAEFLKLEELVEKQGYKPLELEKFIQAGLNNAPLPKLLTKA